jgi:Flp pilus assembly protein TadB
MVPEEELTDETPRITPDQFLAEQKRSIRGKSWWAISIGLTIVLFHVFAFRWVSIFQSVFFVIGALALIAGLWGLYYAKK